MTLTQNGRDDLKTYYGSQAVPVYPCEKSDKTKWWILSPYDAKETWYWILKMLVLPGVIAGIIVVLAAFQLYDNLLIPIVSFVLTYVGTLLLIIYYWEKRRAEIYKIPEDELLKEGITHPLNKIKDPKISVGFVGDIMMMRKYKPEFHSSVKDFFKDVKYIVGNLEGIITDKKPLFSKQAHPKEILNQLDGILSPNTKWLLCVSNNHSIDFGNNLFFDSLKPIQEHKNDQNQENFNVFGRNDVPKVFIGDKICLSTATEWSNQKSWTCTSQCEITKLNNYYCRNKFNILFPHWGYENERYVRTRLKDRAKKLLKKWDLIFAHHPHVRQPVMEVKGDALFKQDGTPVKDYDGSDAVLKKLVAFSGGNFTSGVTFLRKKKHIHGIIMKCQIGPLENDSKHLAVSKVRWEKTINERVDSKTKLIKIGEGIAERSRSYYTFLGIILLVAVFLLYFLDLYF